MMRDCIVLPGIMMVFAKPALVFGCRARDLSPFHSLPFPRKEARSGPKPPITRRHPRTFRTSPSKKPSQPSQPSSSNAADASPCRR
ncbi:hypothetical protein I7I53_06963 [Histoplasma capsulatum var. duboisii H88]|uniref:Uncharacterized protein n=1 Tax=Ajellomyces capsulatus (strain H88) TaxID=544711 RepID=A0A8A1LC17_AJEC8|nr:hypothetical protein I7I53_06963 [Histoplasma capsulatum var. duboisii H88]